MSETLYIRCNRGDHFAPTADYWGCPFDGWVETWIPEAMRVFFTEILKRVVIIDFGAEDATLQRWLPNEYATATLN